MPLYLANPSLTTDPLDGSDIISCPVSGPGVGWIHLGPPGTNQGKALIYSPDVITTAGFDEIGTVTEETTTTQNRNRIGNALGITISATRLNRIIAEILMDHGDGTGQTRWGGIRGFYSQRFSRYEIYLGGLGLVWAYGAPRLPGTQQFTETWPTNSTTISSGQDQSWTEQTGSDVEVSSGVLRAVNLSVGNVAICNSVLDTPNQAHEADYALTNDASGARQVRVNVRHQDEDNYYAINMQRNNGTFLRSILKRVAASNTTFASDTTDPGASGTCKIIVDGSTITGEQGGSTILGPSTDASPQLTSRRTGGVLVFAAAQTASLDNHTIEDLPTGSAITFVAGTTKGTTGAPGRTGDGALTISFPTGYTATANDFAIAALYNDQGDGSTPTDWTELTGSPFGTDTPKMCIFYKVLAGGESAPSTTISGSALNASHCANMAIYINVDTTTPIDVIGAGNQGTGTPMTATGVTSVTADARALFWCGRGDNESASGQTFGGSSTGVTEQLDGGTDQGNDSQVSMADKLLTTAGSASGDGSSTTSATDPWVAVILALRELGQTPPAGGDAARTHHFMLLGVGA